MNSKIRRDIRNKARLACGLANILKYDVDNLVTDASDGDHKGLMETVQETKETLQNLADTIAEIEYILYLDRFKES